jgi:hypothetical protein
MKAYRVEKQIAANGELKLNALPFKEGDRAEVIILSHGTGPILGRHRRCAARSLNIWVRRSR